MGKTQSSYAAKGFSEKSGAKSFDDAYQAEQKKGNVFRDTYHRGDTSAAQRVALGRGFPFCAEPVFPDPSRHRHRFSRSFFLKIPEPPQIQTTLLFFYVFSCFMLDNPQPHSIM
ncbi:hypothetical protein EDM56_00970 [Brevibacillus fluminis]|uniref:Uncharacterized protein n=1 Tax=Brevibacillus fluminis TaxID=511487 RepID=A0A3M8DVU6_9BACL|nr:hypothetical protein [Brevibacillus fluminis]RNB92303.1 hypothetical protein EDM56_00970 [Brevibacillus fluminis]